MTLLQQMIQDIALSSAQLGLTCCFVVLTDWLAAHLPALFFFELDVLACLCQQLLHLEHIASASICTGLQRDLCILGDPLIHCLGYLQ